MEKFLRHTKNIVGKLSSTDKVHAVIGNESCDLDSIVSALAYAFFQHKNNPQTNTVFIPVINVDEIDFPLRTEAIVAFKRQKIPTDLLLFRDQLSLVDLHDRGQLKLTLVDHNVLPQQCAQLEPSVVEVLDHHVKERKDNERVCMQVEMVGSCCTLVAEKYFSDMTCALPKELAWLMYATILIDTVGLLRSAGRTTDKDEQIIQKLERNLGFSEEDRKPTFDLIQGAKFDVSGLTTNELLRKDLKSIKSDKMSIAISSIPIHIKDLLLYQNLAEELERFCLQQEVDVTIVMSLFVAEDGSASRQIAVYSKNTEHRQQIVSALMSDESLKLKTLPSPVDLILAFDQGEVRLSRKYILPLVKLSLR